jgi:hypothetical protein
MAALEQVPPDVLMRLASAVHEENGSLADLERLARVWVRIFADGETDNADALWMPYDGASGGAR